MRRLVVMRHAKSDWSAPVGDRQRPMTRRGRRQADEAGRWLAEQDWTIDLAVVSPAVRAAGAWEVAAAHLPEPPPVTHDEAAYTFEGEGLRRLVRALPKEVKVVALVGHNPAVSELVEDVTGRWVQMTTSALAVVELDSWHSRMGRLAAFGRPPGSA